MPATKNKKPKSSVETYQDRQERAIHEARRRDKEESKIWSPYEELEVEMPINFNQEDES